MASPELQKEIDRLYKCGEYAVCTCTLQTTVYVKGFITKCDCGKKFSDLEREYVPIIADMVNQEKTSLKEHEDAKKGGGGGSPTTTYNETISKTVVNKFMPLKLETDSKWDDHIGAEWDADAIITKLSEIYDNITVKGCKTKMLDLFRGTKADGLWTPKANEERVKYVAKLLEDKLDPDTIP